jgi:hypothetical protein
VRRTYHRIIHFLSGYRTITTWVSGYWLFLLLFFTICNIVQAQDSLGMRCVSTLDYWSDVYYLQMVGNLAYMSSGYSGLRIMDLSDPVNPLEIGRSPWSPWDYLINIGVYVKDSLAYLTYDNEGRVLDVSDPTHPTEIHHWYLDYTPIIRFVHGDVAVGVDQETAHPYLMDISDWNNVQVTSDLLYANSSWPVGMVDDYLCLAGWRVEMYDISDPWNPVLIASVGEGVPAVLSGDYLYSATAHDGVHIYDVSDPLNPIGVAACDSGYCCWITVGLSHLYVSKGSWSIDNWDVADPSSPVFVGAYFFPLNWESWISSSGNLLCAALGHSEDQSVAVFDISNPASPIEVSRFGKRGSLGRLVIEGAKGYLSDIRAGFHVIDLADPSWATELGRPLGFVEFRDIAAHGNYVYGADWYNGLVTYGVINPAHPESLSCWYLGGYHTFMVCAEGDYVYATHGGILDIFSLANPAAPMLLDSIEFSGGVMRASNGYLYTRGIDRIYIYSLVNPSNPQFLGSCILPSYWGGIVRDIAFAGHYAYVAYYEGGVQIIDIANPEHPAVVGSTGGSYVWGIAASGNTLAFYQIPALYQQAMIYIMDISDPVYPRYIGHYNISEMISDMEIYGSYLLTVSPNKFAVYQVDALSSVQPHESLPQEFALYPCYPNPFNSSTIIRFSLPYTEHAKLTIYDVTGRQVKVLADELLNVGEHSVTFNGSNLASGVYFTRLETNHRTQTEKVVLLK